MRVFLDTNILLDTIVVRDDPQFTDNAATILTLGDAGILDLYMSVLSIPTIAYVLKNMNARRKKHIIQDLVSIVSVLPTLPEHVDSMLQSPMSDIENARKQIKKALEEFGVKEKRANECANFVLPRATETSLTIGFTPEALIHFMHKRLCNRAQPEIKKLALLIQEAVGNVNPEFASELVPHCQHLLWCPEGEKMTCGAYPTKDNLKSIMERSKNNE